MRMYLKEPWKIKIIRLKPKESKKGVHSSQMSKYLLFWKLNYLWSEVLTAKLKKNTQKRTKFLVCKKQQTKQYLSYIHKISDSY